MILFYPVLKRYWKHHELWDGTYTITDLFDIYEAISVKSMTEKIYIDYETSKLKSELENNLPI